jgi:capsular polysaccharide transport system permease protein
LAEAQLVFINGEHQLVENKLSEAQTNLLLFQQQYNLLDPTAEGMAMQQITYGLEGQIAAKEAELKTLSSIMSKASPQVLRANTELQALKEQLLVERSKLATDGTESVGVGEIMAQFTDLKIKMELALQAYTASQVSLDKSRIEAYKQMKFLIVVESATLPEDNRYPDTIYNITLFFILVSMVYAIGRIIILTIKELK